MRNLWHDLIAAGVPSGPITSGDQDALDKGHSLSALCERVERNLALLDFPRLPDAMCKSTMLIENLEKGDPTKLRYPRGRNLEESYKEPTVAKLGDLHTFIQEGIRHCRVRNAQDRTDGDTCFECFFDELLYED